MPGLPLKERRLRGLGWNARQIASIGRRTMLRAATGVNATAATLTIGTTNAAVKYDAPLWRGVTGNSIRVAHITAGNNTPLTVSVSGKDITVNLATSAGGVATSTAAQVAAAVNGTAAANNLVTASLPGTGASVAVAAAMTSLSGGTGGS
jgi:hypothetical protein